VCWIDRWPTCRAASQTRLRPIYGCLRLIEAGPNITFEDLRQGLNRRGVFDQIISECFLSVSRQRHFWRNCGSKALNYDLSPHARDSFDHVRKFFDSLYTRSPSLGNTMSEFDVLLTKNCA
jgi:hypothetical protein